MDNLDHIREQNRWKPDQQNEGSEKPKSTISSNAVILMLLTATFFDCLQALLSPIAPFITVFAFLTFWFWFKAYDVSFMSLKRIIALLGGGVAETIPVLDILPLWIGIVWYLIGTTKMEEITAKIPGGKAISNAVKKRL